MRIFPDIKFSRSELHEIATHVANPAVQKYLQSLAYNAGVDICMSARKEGESPESFLERVAYVKGGLGVIETLLAIEAAPAPGPV